MILLPSERTSTSSSLLPPPVRRLREHLREIRRLAGETHQWVLDMAAAIAEKLNQLEGELREIRRLTDETQQRVELGTRIGEKVTRMDAHIRDHSRTLSRIEARLEEVTKQSQPSRGRSSLPQFSETVRDATALARLPAQNPAASKSADSPARLTVIIPTYNREQYVAVAIESVLAQHTSFPIKVILSDDGSTDSTPDILERYQARNPEVITVLRSDKNLGQFAAVIRALTLSSTDYLTWLDSDDYWVDERYLQRGVDFLEDHPDFVIYSRNTYLDYPDGSRSTYHGEDLPVSDFTSDDYLQNRAFVSHTASTIFRNVLFQSGVPTVFVNVVGIRGQSLVADDVDRYFIHILRGKARFENPPNGVYRITGEGWWTRQTDFEKSLWEAETRLDQWRYVDYQHPAFFLGEALRWGKRCLQIMNETVATGSSDASITEERAAAVWRVVAECLSHTDLLETATATG